MPASSVGGVPPEDECPGCGLLLATEDGPTHRYLTASPACWRSFTDLLATFYSAADRLVFRQLVVDAYAAQHPGAGGREQVQSVGIHLMTLSLFLEHGADPVLGSDLHRRMVRRPVFHRVEPRGRSDLTVRHVPLDGPATAARERSLEWAGAVWGLYADDHETVRSWLRDAGFDLR